MDGRDIVAMLFAALMFIVGAGLGASVGGQHGYELGMAEQSKTDDKIWNAETAKMESDMQAADMCRAAKLLSHMSGCDIR